MSVVHVTVKMQPDVWNLRSRRSFRVIERALYHAAHHWEAVLVQFSVQGNHIHLLIEAPDARTLARSVQGFAIRTAKGLNRMMGRRGRVFSDRYHSRLVKTPTEARRVMAYLTSNARKHATFPDERVQPGYVDPYSSEASSLFFALPAAETWLLRTGWQRGKP
ncbi:MAG: transposase [Thermomicrobiales bacterium]